MVSEIFVFVAVKLNTVLLANLTSPSVAKNNSGVKVKVTVSAELLF